MIPSHALELVRKTALQHQGAYEKLSHGSPCFFVEKGKQFVAFVDNHHGDGRLALWLLAPREIQTALIEENPEAYFRPAYVGAKGWVGVCLDRGLRWEVVEDLIAEAYRLACPVTRRRSKI